MVGRPGIDRRLDATSAADHHRYWVSFICGHGSVP
jgi:hypothetical protein